MITDNHCRVYSEINLRIIYILLFLLSLFIIVMIILLLSILLLILNDPRFCDDKRQAVGGQVGQWTARPLCC